MRRSDLDECLDIGPGGGRHSVHGDDPVAGEQPRECGGPAAGQALSDGHRPDQVDAVSFELDRDHPARHRPDDLAEPFEVRHRSTGDGQDPVVGLDARRLGSSTGNDRADAPVVDIRAAHPDEDGHQ